MEIETSLLQELLKNTLEEGRIYFFHQGTNLGGGKGADNHPHICVKTGQKVLVLTIVSSQVDTTRQKLLKWNRVKEEEVPVILSSKGNKLQKDRCYVECNNAYICEIEDFVKALEDGRIFDTGGCLSDIDLLAVYRGVLCSDQVPEEVKDILEGQKE